MKTEIQQLKDRLLDLETRLQVEGMLIILNDMTLTARLRVDLLEKLLATAVAKMKASSYVDMKAEGVRIEEEAAAQA